MAAKDDDAAAYDVATLSKPDPVAVHFTVGNTYRQLSPTEASYDRTGRHLKIHDWTLYVDVLPGQDPDIIDRVTFDMRDNSFATQAFTCHCPIRIQAGIGSAFIGQISGCDNQNNSQAQFGQATKEEEDKSIPTSSTTRPHPNLSRWRFSTRQQTYGSVDVQISIRGRGGCKSIVPYTIVLRPGGHECPEGSLTPFVEKRPHQPLKPLKMMDSEFAVEIQFPTLDACSSLSLSEIAKSVYGRSKIPIVLEQKGNVRTEEFSSKSCGSSLPWLMKLSQSTFHGKLHDNMTNTTATISISSPILVGGHGLNECYKIIEGLPLSSTCILPSNSNIPRHLSSSCTTCLYVQVDVTTLSIQQIVKVCQNFVKYEDAMDSFMPWQHREDRSEYCRSNKQAVEGTTNKQRNQRISKCETMEDLLKCFNPMEEHHYKLHLRRIGMGNATPDVITNDATTTTSPKRAIEFRQHASPKDKTAMTHWIRFCSAFVRNSSRLRSPSALKSTTSLDEEFELLFEYVVKDRALRNYYRMRRDDFMLEDEKNACCLGALSEEVESVGKSSSDSMSISDESCCNNDDATSAYEYAAATLRKRSDTPSQVELNKRACLQLLKS
ncbi:hypothetical protein ACHAWU_003095 [Discostella pseudostelligera]|uniref:Uncharacterized protein n=1 Tax=Discostella pseudostelligera TaxID=259834 RepID=A0ABD3MR87_9STRA